VPLKEAKYKNIKEVLMSESNIKKPSVYDDVKRQFNKAADIMALDPDIRKILAHTINEISINFPVKMDNGHIEIFSGYKP